MSIVTSDIRPNCVTAEASVDEPSKSYGQILKSTALIGGSSVINIGMGVLRTKALAVLLGPGGVGLVGLYSSIIELTRSVAAMGINSSGMRQIAEAVGSGDQRRIAVTVTTIRRLALCLGALGALSLLALCVPITRLTFGDNRHTAEVALFSIVVLCSIVSAGQAALVQGMRRIADLARISVLGGLLGTLIGVPIIFLLGERGIVAYLISVAAIGMLTSWSYARKISVEDVQLSWPQVATEASALLKLGFVFMVIPISSFGTAYLVRVLVLRKLGLDAAGQYQAAWAIAGLYVGFILQAMGADFFPRLSGVASNNAECNRLVNEQTEVGLLLAGPGVLATLTIAPLVIRLFYSSQFDPAVELLRWNCLGMILRVVSWPLGFVFMARGLRGWILINELSASAIHVGLAWLCLSFFGLRGAGIAFAGLYAFSAVFVFAVVRNLSVFRWSSANLRLGAVYGPSILAVFVGWYVLPTAMVVLFGLVTTLVLGYSSLKRLCRLVPAERLPQIAQKLMVWLRLNPVSTNV